MPRTPSEVRDWNTRTDFDREAHRLAAARRQQDVVALVADGDTDQLVALVQAHGDLAVASARA